MKLVSALRATAVAALLAGLLATTTLLAPGATAATVRNGDLLVPLVDGMVIQAPQSSTYTTAIEGYSLSSTGRFSPDGRSIAFSRGSSMWVHDVATGAERQVSTTTQTYGRPSWSPDGTQLAFTTGGDVRVMSVATGAQRTVLSTGGAVTDADWSPDGTRIVFSTWSRIQLVRPDGTGLRTLFKGGGTQPDWSPDSQHVALITSAYGKRSEVVTVARRGGAVVRVTELAYPQGYWHQGVAWSPDGTRIAVLQANKNGPPDDIDSDERQKVRAYLPDGSRSWQVIGPIYGDDAPLYLDWGRRVG